MKVREEINLFSKEEDKPILLLLFDKYHWQSEWGFVAKCHFEGKFPSAKRIWEPTEAGIILYNHYSKEGK